VSSRNLASYLLLFALLFCECASGQSKSSQEAPLNAGARFNQTTIPIVARTNIARILYFPQPPRSFDAITASNAELARYGYPLKPDKTRSFSQYQLWKKSITLEQTCISIDPHLSYTNVYHSPNHILHQQQMADGTVSTDSENWSGYSVVTNGSVFLNQNTRALSYYRVPSVITHYAPGNTSVAVWIGFDGQNSDDVVQCGTSTDTTGNQTDYYAWFEHFPAPEMRIDNLPIRPQDNVLLDIDLNPPNVYLRIINASIHKGAHVLMPLTGFTGNCVEWVTERPTKNGQLTILSDYGSFGFNGASAYCPPGLSFFPGKAASPWGTLNNITMYANGKKCSTAQVPDPKLYQNIKFNSLGPWSERQ
jgi:hypothetical protein